jgi:hypothetical protein
MAKISVEKMVIVTNGPPQGFTIDPVPPHPKIPEPVVALTIWSEGVRMVILLSDAEAEAVGVSVIRANERARRDWVALNQPPPPEEKCKGSLEANGITVVRS